MYKLHANKIKVYTLFNVVVINKVWVNLEIEFIER